jgi:uncharacterized protein (AIM24 family)
VAPVAVVLATAMVELAKQLLPGHVEGLLLELVRLKLGKIKVIFTKTAQAGAQAVQVAPTAPDLMATAAKGMPMDRPVVWD